MHGQHSDFDFQMIEVSVRLTAVHGEAHFVTAWMNEYPTGTRRDAREFEFPRFRFDYISRQADSERDGEQGTFPNDVNRITGFHR